MSANEFEVHYSPQSLALIATEQCTAQCSNCCFKCGPKMKRRIPLDKILYYIEQVPICFPTIKLVIFSGGECFLLGRDLDTAIRACAQKNLMTRCVTNGYWAKSKKDAIDRLDNLKNAGLTEINFSTGDEHQQYVPLDSVINGVEAGVNLGMSTVVVIEGHLKSKFNASTFYQHSDVIALSKTAAAQKLLHVMSNVWVCNDTICGREQKKTKGCVNILDTFAITPDQHLVSCCGLAVMDIKEMDMGKLENGNIGALYSNQLNDFMKIWLRVDGPEAIIKFAKEKVPELNISILPHSCQNCALIFNNPIVKNILREHFLEKVPDVLFRLALIKNVGG